jgi:hypothetical protein
MGPLAPFVILISLTIRLPITQIFCSTVTPRGSATLAMVEGSDANPLMILLQVF